MAAKMVLVIAGKTGATVLDLDYLSEDSILKAAADYGDECLDVEINCAGTLTETDQMLLGLIKASRSRRASPGLEREHIGRPDDKVPSHDRGPFLATKAFLPSLKKSPAGKVINISSDYASVSENNRGRCVGYRMAKSALNQQTVTIAHELKAAGHEITMLALDPGDVPTKLSGGNGKTDIDASVRGM